MSKNPSDNSEEITYKKLKADLDKLISTVELESEEKSQYTQAELTAKQLAVNIYGQKQFLDLQDEWGRNIKWQIWFVLFFQAGFILLVGFNGSFTDNINKLPGFYIGVILETLANIVALGLVVAKFLFPDQKKFILPPKS